MDNTIHRSTGYRRTTKEMNKRIRLEERINNEVIRVDDNNGNQLEYFDNSDLHPFISKDLGISCSNNESDDEVDEEFFELDAVNCSKVSRVVLDGKMSAHQHVEYLQDDEEIDVVGSPKTKQPRHEKEKPKFAPKPINFDLIKQQASNEDAQRGLALETEPSKTTFSDHAASSQADANMAKEKETAGLIPVQVIASSSSSAVLPHPKNKRMSSMYRYLLELGGKVQEVLNCVQAIQHQPANADNDEHQYIQHWPIANNDDFTELENSIQKNGKGVEAALVRQFKQAKKSDSKIFITENIKMLFLNTDKYTWTGRANNEGVKKCSTTIFKDVNEEQITERIKKAINKFNDKRPSHKAKVADDAQRWYNFDSRRDEGHDTHHLRGQLAVAHRIVDVEKRHPKLGHERQAVVHDVPPATANLSHLQQWKRPQMVEDLGPSLRRRLGEGLLGTGCAALDDGSAPRVELAANFARFHSECFNTKPGYKGFHHDPEDGPCGQIAYDDTTGSCYSFPDCRNINLCSRERRDLRFNPSHAMLELEDLLARGQAAPRRIRSMFVLFRQEERFKRNRKGKGCQLLAVMSSSRVNNNTMMIAPALSPRSQARNNQVIVTFRSKLKVVNGNVERIGEFQGNNSKSIGGGVACPLLRKRTAAKERR
ncbi:conserved hypothetical protein [Culex quinquefasciatus]|uniref:Uncharacterized protein n=1 Tax=Culex quinquefasciatus TaxID=7176 RepID=B0W7F2_CULQU|nr:conserved hypothetical protein [Culex quinquefasciatus]|eukprot:XP_001844636.1 conserved hypothetical protein [Culex quinquefasciatus]